MSTESYRDTVAPNPKSVEDVTAEGLIRYLAAHAQACNLKKWDVLQTESDAEKVCDDALVEKARSEYMMLTNMFVNEWDELRGVEETHRYEYELSRSRSRAPGAAVRTETRSGIVEHRYSDGAWRLVQRVLHDALGDDDAAL